jgi:hypothetical protein
MVSENMRGVEKIRRKNKKKMANIEKLRRVAKRRTAEVLRNLGRPRKVKPIPISHLINVTLQ